MPLSDFLGFGAISHVFNSLLKGIQMLIGHRVWQPRRATCGLPQPRCAPLPVHSTCSRDRSIFSLKNEPGAGSELTGEARPPF